MNIRFLNLALAVFWFSLFAGMLTREHWMPEWMAARAETPQTPIVIATLLMLTFWNVTKYMTSRRAARNRQRIASALKTTNRTAPREDPPIIDPQFSFEDNGPPSPSQG